MGYVEKTLKTKFVKFTSLNSEYYSFFFLLMLLILVLLNINYSVMCCGMWVCKTLCRLFTLANTKSVSQPKHRFL